MNDVVDKRKLQDRYQAAAHRARFNERGPGFAFALAERISTSTPGPRQSRAFAYRLYVRYSASVAAFLSRLSWRAYSFFRCISLWEQASSR
jgi:hypothetical protein